MPLNSLKPEHDNKAVIIGGGIVDVREITTKNGQKMAFVKLEDRFGEIEVILFPGAYQQTVGLWERDRVVLVRGKISAKDREGNIGEELKVLVDDAREITVQQAQAYQATGKKLKALAATKRKGVTVSTSASKAAPAASKRVYIRLKDSGDRELLRRIKQIVDTREGDGEVVLIVGSDDNKQAIRLPNKITLSPPVISELTEVVGASNLKY